MVEPVEVVLLGRGSAKGGYAARVDLSTGKRMKVTMHRLIFMRYQPEGTVEPPDVDHKNNHKLDNRLDNLRPATRHQNSGNRGPNKNSKSGYKGVDSQTINNANNAA